MRLGIMQPYFFPYLGYFELIRRTDQWIVFDTAQYIRHGWVNRNRILHPTEGWQYIIVPLRKHAVQTPIRDIRVNDDIAWRARILGQLDRYRRAPHFASVRRLVEDCLDNDESSLARLNAQILARTCRYLGIPFRARFLSDLALDLPQIRGPGDWALRISERLGATEYVNPPGGRELFDPSAFARAGIALTFLDLPPLTYSCPGFSFEPGLSIVDVLMWNAPGQVVEFMERHAALPRAAAEG
jgi:hypothetical protein